MVRKHKPRIAIYTRTFPPKGGGVASAHYNLYLLLRRDYDVKVFAFDDSCPSVDPDAVRMKSPAAISKILRFYVKRKIRKFDPYGKIEYSYWIANVAFSVMMLNYSLHKFSPDLIIMPDNFVPGYFVLKPKKSKLIWMSRNNFKRFENQPLVRQGSWMDIALAHSMERRAMRKANVVVCPSDYMKRVFRETYPSNLPVKIIYNFMDKEILDQIMSFDIRDTIKVSADTLLVYIPSGGSPVKGKRYVYEIIRRLSKRAKIAFYISGHIDNELNAELSHVDKKVKIYAPGHLSYKENLQIVAACDIGISPTLIENLSNSIVEGLFLRVPFVTFDTGGNSEIIKNGTNGYVVPYLDVDTLVEKAESLLTNTKLLNEMKSHTLEFIQKVINNEKILLQYHQLFKELKSK